MPTITCYPQLELPRTLLIRSNGTPFGATVAQHPATAFIDLVRTLTLATFFEGSQVSCLEITPKSAWLSGHAPGIDESVAEKQTAERHAAWGKRLPQEPEALWTFIHGLFG
jgi:ParB family chromosome partitioning protein